MIDIKSASFDVSVEIYLGYSPWINNKIKFELKAAEIWTNVFKIDGTLLENLQWWDIRWLYTSNLRWNWYICPRSHVASQVIVALISPVLDL